jgi:DNA-binding CsgD family transcriptional regulator
MPGSFVLRCSSAPLFCFTLSSGIATLGRSLSCKFVVDHPSISREHARIVVEDIGLSLTDLDSLNGTFVDNNRVKSARVRRGQTIRFGNVPFLVTIKDLDEETEPCKNGKDSVLVAGSRNLANLSEARRRVFDLLVSGTTEKVIAHRLKLSPHTVHKHVGAIFRTFEVHSRAELLALLLLSNGDNGEIV